MTFALLADEFHSDPKTVKATLAGAGLYARALSYCAHYLTDGFVPFAWAAEIAKPAVRRSVLEAGLWVEVAGGEVFEYVDGDESYTVTVPGKGFFIPDFLAFNPAREHVLRKRSELSAKRSAAGKKGAANKWRRVRINKEMRVAVATALGLSPGQTSIRPCAYCGTDITVDWSQPDRVRFLDSEGRATPEIDHVEALANGGAHAVENLRLACLLCNRSKGARNADDWPGPDKPSSKPSSKPVASVWPPSPTPKEPRAVALDVADGPGFEQLERMAVLATKEMR